MQNQTFNWYGVKLLYVYTVVGEPDIKLVDDSYIDGYIAYEESILVIQANSFDTAYQKAAVVAKEKEDDYQNIYGQNIQIRYYDAVDCYLIEDTQESSLQDGVEIYSRLIDSNAAEEPKRFLERLYPISDSPKFMLFNREFSR